MKQKAIIINDTRRENPIHLGCQLVMKNIFQLCERHNLEVIASIPEQQAYKVEKLINNIDHSDVLILNGEGTMHHDQEAATSLIKTVQLYKSYKKPCVLINSVWQENIKLNKNLYLFDKIFVRDGFSKKEIQQAGYHATIVPDLTFYQPVAVSEKKVNTTGKTIIVDSVIGKKYSYLMKLAFQLKAPFWYMGKSGRPKPLGRYLREKLFAMVHPVQNMENLQQLENVRLIISGRFHAICMAIMYNIPFMFVPSNTFKIESILNDIGLEVKKYHFENYQGSINSSDIYMFIQPVFEKDVNKLNQYVKEARQKQHTMFQDIYNISKKAAEMNKV